MLTDTQLAQIMRNASPRQRAACLEPMNAAMGAHGIDASLPRIAAFIAQIAHESGELRFMEELWGPTPAQKRYEPPGDLAKRLGNTEPGDGLRFKGRGPIQVTGRFNYRNYGQLLGIDLETTPETAATPVTGFAIAALFWASNGLNALADAGDFERITQRINGGQNGAADRLGFLERARQVLAGAFPSQGPVSAPDVAAQGPSAAGLERGAEALLEDERRPPPAAPRPRGGRKAAAAQPKADGRVLNARPDTLDFRDLMYTPSLVEVPTHVPLNEYLEFSVPVLDQGQEGACTGFGLATVANYLLLRRRVIPDPVPVSPRMFYELARRYDEWPGENYSGSSARGAIKGWHKHGVCTETEYPYTPGNSDPLGLNDARTTSALKRPLGAYFRVNHKDIVAMHSAISEVGVLYVTCAVHQGWNGVAADGVITQSPNLTGGHAFAIVAYGQEGFWIQNSWGTDWGRGGFALLSYDDWLANGTDAWVARLGAPVTLRKLESAATTHAASSAQSAAYSFADLRPHIVSVGNDGVLKAGGDYGSTTAELARIFEEDIPRVTGRWARPRVMLYAHGGLVSERAAVQRLAEYRPRLLEGEVYPLAFIWRTDYLSTLANILRDAFRRRRPEGFIDDAKDFMLDRLDDALEPLARRLTGKSAWDEMKQNARAASLGQGAAVLVANHLKALRESHGELDIHLVGHSAGSILHGPLVGLLSERELPISSCTLWAPACTVDLFNECYLPALEKKMLRRLALFVLSDRAEQDDDCAHIYNKSLLYLVSHAFEERERIPSIWPLGRRDDAGHDGVPILGMQCWHDDALRDTFRANGVDVIVAPNSAPDDSPDASNASHHGDFDDDERTVMATFRRIAGASAGAVAAVRPAQASAPSPTARSRKTKTDRRTPAADTSGRRAMFSRSESWQRTRRQQLDWKTR